MLKAIAIVFVLLWHLQPIKLFPIQANTIHKVLYFFNINVTLIAVPLFYLVSIVLIFKKSTSFLLSQRIVRLLSIYFFWSAIQIAMRYLTINASDFFNWGLQIQSQPMWKYIVMGGPPLPIVGDSVFYFLFNLMVLTSVSFLYSKIQEKWRSWLSWFLICIYCGYFYNISFINSPIPYWRIDNFFVYIPLADILCKKRKISLLYLSIALFVAFVTYETLQHHNYSIYARNSILFGAMSLYLAINQFAIEELPSIVKKLSLYSLGIFAIHKYWMMIFVFCLSLTFNFLKINKVVTLANNYLSALQLAAAFFAILFTFLTVYLFSLSRFLNKYVR